MDFWTRLKNEIRAKNTTQEWVAGRIGVPLGTFKKWMTRKTYPNIKEGLEIARLLETTVEYLVTGERPEFPEYTDGIERQLVGTYRRLGPADRENTLLAMNAWLRKRYR